MLPGIRGHIGEPRVGFMHLWSRLWPPRAISLILARLHSRPPGRLLRPSWQGRVLGSGEKGPFRSGFALTAGLCTPVARGRTRREETLSMALSTSLATDSRLHG